MVKVKEHSSLISQDPSALIPLLVDRYQSIIEHHKVVTKDGYILTLERIRVTLNPSYRDPVLIVHGLACHGSHWLLNKEEKCLPYILGHEGYDCWLANLRGAELSKAHKTLDTESQQFWDFSWDEMARFDIPAIINYILLETGKESLFYIGHSMGCLVLFGCLSLHPEYNARIRKMIALAPPLRGKYLDNLYLRFGVILGFGMSRIRSFYSRQVPLERRTLSQHISLLLFPPFTSIPGPDKIGALILSTIGVMCGITGRNQVESHRMLNISKHWPSTTSLKTAFHMAQLYSCETDPKLIKFYDYGRLGNLKEYGSEEAPTYSLDKVRIPISIFSSSGDQLCPSKDIEEAITLLQNVEEHIHIPDPRFAHIDYLMGKDAHVLVYDRILDIINEASRRERESLPYQDDKVKLSSSPTKVEIEAKFYFNDEGLVCKNPEGL